MEIGIIGFGNFGKFMARHLKEKAAVFVTDIADKRKEAEEIGVIFTSLIDVLQKKIIILAVPMENLEGMLHKIKDKVKSGTLVLDVCSLKIFSCRAMEKILPKNVEIIGTHPLFGPQSAPCSIKGMSIVLCNVRSRKIKAIKKFCESLGLNVIITTPEKHDMQMAISQALTHFIGQIAKHIKLKRVELSTKTFDDLMNIMDIIKNDTKELFENMQTMNPFAEQERDKFILEGIRLNNLLKQLKAGK